MLDGGREVKQGDRASQSIIQDVLLLYFSATFETSCCLLTMGTICHREEKRQNLYTLKPDLNVLKQVHYQLPTKNVSGCPE